MGCGPGSCSFLSVPRALANPESDQFLEMQKWLPSTSKAQGVVEKRRFLLSEGKKDPKALGCPRRTNQSHIAYLLALSPLTSPQPLLRYHLFLSPGNRGLGVPKVPTVCLTPSSWALSRELSATQHSVRGSSETVWEAKVA